MKNFSLIKAAIRVAGIIALAAVIGFSMAACDNGSSPGGKPGTGDTNTVATPTATPGASMVESGTTVTLTSATTGAEIYYTNNGNTPTTSSMKYTSPIAVTAAVTIKAIAVKDGTTSGVLEAAYTIGTALTGNITISPPGPVVTGTELTATYSGGTETVTYQWKRGTNNVGTGTTYTPDQEGSYTVTVSADGKIPKTSAAVTVSDPELSGTITISPSSGVTVGTQLTATYSGGTETVTYQWKRGTNNVGTGTTYTPDQAGSYTVTVSASGYKSKTSAAVTVTTSGGGGKVAKPTATPEGYDVSHPTELDNNATITLATATQGAEIWYTTNNNPPAKNGATSTRYTDPISFTTSALDLKAIAVKDGMTDSDVLYAYYMRRGSSGGGNEGSIKDIYRIGVTFGSSATVTANSITYNYGSKTIPNAGTGGGGTITMGLTSGGNWAYVFSDDTKIGIVYQTTMSVMGNTVKAVGFYFGQDAIDRESQLSMR